MCAALSSYARACAAKGVMLWGWRERVCSESLAGPRGSGRVLLLSSSPRKDLCGALS